MVQLVPYLFQHQDALGHENVKLEHLGLGHFNEHDTSCVLVETGQYQQILTLIPAFQGVPSQYQLFKIFHVSGDGTADDF